MTRNRYGFKDSIDTYRTFNGQLYLAWLEFPSADRIDDYRRDGIRCRRLRTTLFVHEDDTDKAATIDEAKDPRP
jgi:hypothetical protein